jgi:uncharacterized membrane protein YphA (DoxX/SURF4 family)
MDTARLIASLALAGVFLVAGLSKLADRQGSRQVLMDFGVPVPLGILLLAVADLAVAATLIPAGRSATVPA